MSQPVPNQVYTLGSGTASTERFINIITDRDPTPQDVNYLVQQRWINKTTGREHILIGFTPSQGIQQADWLNLGSGTGSTEYIRGNFGGAVPPDGSNIIDFVGDGNTISILGTPALNQLVANVLLPPANTLIYSNQSEMQGIAFGPVGEVLTGQGPTLPPIWTTPSAPGGIVWSEQTANFTAAANTGNVVTATATANLVVLPQNGDTILFVSAISGGGTLTIVPAAGEKLSIGTVLGSASGTAVSTDYGDSLTLTYLTSTNTWYATSIVGNWTVS